MADKKREERREFLFKEVDIIQEIIKRMASNSFMLKGWSVLVVSVALLLKGENKYNALIAYVPALVFWILDSYFLRQERFYRKLYDWVIANRLTSDEYLLDMKPQTRFAAHVQSTARIMFSITLSWFHGMILLLLILYCAILFGADLKKLICGV